MSRSYSKVRPHQDRVYAAEAVLALYKISANTLGNWGHQGLRAIQGTRPRLYRGAELVRFHSEREARMRKVLREGEFKCFGCKAVVSPEPSTVRLHKTPKFSGYASCPLCGTALTKKLGETEYDKFLAHQDANTTWDRSGEGSGAEAVGIGGSGQGPVIRNAENERLIYEWQVFAGKYSDKTVNAHLADIRRFEAFTGRKSFTDITPAQAAAYRDQLVAGYRVAVGDKRLSASTVRHAASYLRSFFNWVEERGRKAVRPSISGYFALPKSLHQSVAPRGKRDYLPLDEALKTATLLPGDDLLARRDRAIFCLTYVGALRKDALISLRLRHIDIVARLIRHDGRELRAKNGEGSGAEAVGIGGSGQGPVIWNAENERLIYEWQVFAGKYSDKTVNAHLADIRRFEAFTGRKSFTDITPAQAAAYRDQLVAGYRVAVGDKRLSASTVRHAASYLRSFFNWVEERGRKAVRPSISGYFALPKSLHQSVAPRGKRDYLPLDEALKTATLLPGDDLLARRDRAIFCLTYVGALRKDALISLRLRHIDIVARLIRHDGRELRAKNGKDYTISWFPGTEAIWGFVVAWVEELGALGVTCNDALFPDAKSLRGIAVGTCQSGAGARACWEPMDTAHAVGTVFKRASAIVGRKITPHSARHTLASHGDQTVRTPEQRKAWSMTMGHDNETTTWGNYGKMTEEARARAMAQTSEDSTLTYEDLELLVRRLLHVFSRDSPEFQKTEQLLRLAEAKYVGKSD